MIFLFFSFFSFSLLHLSIFVVLGMEEMKELLAAEVSKKMNGLSDQIQQYYKILCLGYYLS